jgi:hypothetical protein
MVIPMKGQYEQQCNAAALNQLGVPVLKTLKIDYLNQIKNWVDLPQNISVDYPDITEEIIDKVKTIVKDVDLFYIDGNHTFEGCMNDFLNYNDLVKNGGYIAFDDYHDVEYSPQVKHAVDFIISDLTYGQYEVIGSFRNSFKTYPPEMPYNNLFIIRKK